MVLRSAQEERAVRPYGAPSAGWPSNAIRRAIGAIQRTSVGRTACVTLTPPSRQHGQQCMVR